MSGPFDQCDEPTHASVIYEASRGYRVRRLDCIDCARGAMTQPPSPAQEPATAHGRDLYGILGPDGRRWWHEEMGAVRLAARAEAFAEIRRGVDGLGFEVPDGLAPKGLFMDYALVSRAAVLALLDPPQ